MLSTARHAAKRAVNDCKLDGCLATTPPCHAIGDRCYVADKVTIVAGIGKAKRRTQEAVRRHVPIRLFIAHLRQEAGQWI